MSETADPELDARRIHDSAAKRIQEFDLEHGGDPIVLYRWYVYGDGARRNVLDGELLDPPDDWCVKQFFRGRYYANRFFIAQEKLTAFLHKGGDSFDAVMLDILKAEVELRSRALAAFEKANIEEWERRGGDNPTSAA